MNNAREHYNKGSHGYAEKWENINIDPDDPRNYFRKRLMEVVLKMSAPLSSNTRVVEIGCGNGLVLREVLKYTNKVFGTDIAIEMLRRVADTTLKDKKVVITDNFLNLGDNDAEVILKENDFLNLDLPGNYFDRILSVEVLRYIDDIDICFKKCRAIMKQDSLFIFTTTNLWSFSLFPIKYSIRKALGIVDSKMELSQYFVTEKLLRGKLKKSGLRIVGFKRVGFLSMNPIARKFIRGEKLSAKIYDIDRVLAHIPILRNFFDTFIVAAKHLS